MDKEKQALAYEPVEARSRYTLSDRTLNIGCLVSVCLIIAGAIVLVAVMIYNVISGQVVPIQK